MQPATRRRPSAENAGPPVLVTDAKPASSVERDERQRRYLVSMGIRTVAFVLAIVLFHGVAQILAIAVSMIMPWMAVLIANAGPRRRVEQPSFFVPPRPRALTAAQPEEDKASRASPS